MLNIVIIGKPNCGKTAIFNALTGSRQKVANYPGVTVERKEGQFKLGDKNVRIFDLPGTYSLSPDSPDEKITKDVLLGNMPSIPKPDFAVCVMDAANISLCLKLALQVKQTGIPFIVALNMADHAEKRGSKIDLQKLSDLLGVPVVKSVAIKRSGLDELKNAIANYDYKNYSIPPEEENKNITDKAQDILNKVIISKPLIDRKTYKIDRLLLHPVFGFLFLLLTVFVIFQAVFNLASYPMDMIDGAVTWLANFANDHLPDSSLKSLISDGIIAGVGSVIIFLPQIIILFFFILLLEDTGYMARAAFLLDRVMGGVGLQGKSFIPLFSSFACAIPGIMATRTIDNSRDRLITIMIAPLMTCSARLPVYALIISAFIPNQQVYGMFSLQGLVLFGLYIAGIISALIVAFIIRKFLLKGQTSHLIIEMPSYHLPNMRNLLLGLYERAKVFLKRAGGIILSIMIVLWFLSSFPKIDGAAPEVQKSFAGVIGKFLEPVFAPIGFNWEIVIALIPGMAAREVAVAALGTVYALSGDDTQVTESLAHLLQNSWSFATAMSFLVWYIFAPQCIATLAAVKRETNSWKMMWLMTIYLFGLAYLGSFITYRVFL